MQPLRFALIAVFCCLLLPASADAGETASGSDAKHWLKRMLSASESLSYEGVFVYLRADQAVEVMRVMHSGVSGHQRMVSLLGPRREVFIENHSVVTLSERQTSFTASQNRSLFPISFPHDLHPLETVYSFAIKGHDRVADRAVRVIAVRPRDRLRFGYLLWLDVETGMVLRSALVGTDGEFLEQLIFTDIRYQHDIDEHRLRPQPPYKQTAARGLTGEADKLPEPVADAWRISPLPAGFRRILAQRLPAVAGGQGGVEHQVLSDGLATVSVFIEPLGEGQPPLLQGATAMGPMSAHGSLVEGHQVLVVGEVPAVTVAMIAEAAGPNGE